MKIRTKIAFLLLTVIVKLTLTVNVALAHSFNFALIIPLSNAASNQGNQYHEGFMLATTERDSHPDQESDGHLGGLDVYVAAIDGTKNLTDDVKRIVTRGEVDIVVAYRSEKTLSLIRRIFDGKKVALLLPGEPPSLNSDLPAVAAFISSYEMAYGKKPSLEAAQGYNSARRIDVAVRALGGVDDMSSLLWIFEETERGFTW